MARFSFPCRCLAPHSGARHVTFGVETFRDAEEEIPDPDEADLVYRGGQAGPEEQGGAGEPGPAHTESGTKESSLPRFFPGML